MPGKLIGAIHAPPLDLSTISTRAQEDPLSLIELCRDEHAHLRIGTRKMHHNMLVTLYACALILYDNQQLLNTLLNDPYFSNRKYALNSKHTLRYVILYATNADKDGPTYKKAVREAHLLQPFFEDGISASELADRIDGVGGLSGLHTADDFAPDANSELTQAVASKTDDGMPASDTEHKTCDVVDAAVSSTSHLASCDQHVNVAWGNARQLLESMQVDDILNVTIRRLPDQYNNPSFEFTLPTIH